MKNRYLLAVLALLVSSHLLAKEDSYLLSIAGVGMSMNYSEYLDDETLYDTEKSDINAIVGVELQASYIQNFENGNYSQIGLSLMNVSGQTQYTGGIIGSGLGYGSYVSSTKNTVVDVELEYRYVSTITDDFELINGVGIGHRAWTRTLSATQVEVYYWHSLRLRMGGIYKYDNISIGGLVQYQYSINPKMSLAIPTSSVILDLRSADIIKLSVPVKYKYSEDINLFMKYVYEKQTIEKSNVVEGWLEPRSEAYNQYLKFGAEFKF